jgi:hypothetical protein
MTLPIERRKPGGDLLHNGGAKIRAGNRANWGEPAEGSGAAAGNRALARRGLRCLVSQRPERGNCARPAACARMDGASSRVRLLRGNKRAGDSGMAFSEDGLSRSARLHSADSHGTSRSGGGNGFAAGSRRTAEKAIRGVYSNARRRRLAPDGTGFKRG